MISPASRFGCLRGIREFSERWGTFLVSSIFLCVVVLPLAQGGRMEGRLLLSTTSMCLWRLWAQAQLGTRESFSLYFITLCLCT